MKLEKEHIFSVGNKTYRLEQTIPLGHVTQQYSHFCLQAEIRLLEIAVAKPQKEWHTPDRLTTLPFSNAEHKMFDLLGRYDALN